LTRIPRVNIILTAFYILLAIALFGGLIWGNTLYSRNHPGETSFLVPWLAARTFLDYGDSPYSDPTTQRTQIVYYGRLALEDEDPLILSVPFPGELFYFPFATIRDYDLAHGVWMTLSEVAFVTLAILSLQLIGWRPSRFFLPLALLFPILWAFGFLDLVTSSAIPFILLAFIGSLSAQRAGQDEIAGILLIFPLWMVESFGVLLLLMLGWIFDARRWRILFGLGMSLLVLVLLSFLLLPDWIMPWLRGFHWHRIYNPGLSVYDILGTIWPVVGPRLGWILTAFLVILLIVEWRDARKRDFRHFLWLACLTLSATPLIGFRFSIQNFTLLTIPIFLFIAIFHERWPGRGIWRLPEIALIAFWILSWVLVVVLNANWFPLIPALLIAGFLWMKWWVLHPPRTVFESKR